MEDHILEGKTLNGLGTAWQQKGEWDKAADYYRQAIDLRQKTGDLTGLGTSITYLGHVYNLTGRNYSDPGGPEHLQDSIAQDGRRWRLQLGWAF